MDIDGDGHRTDRHARLERQRAIRDAGQNLRGRGKLHGGPPVDAGATIPPRCGEVHDHDLGSDLAEAFEHGQPNILSHLVEREHDGCHVVRAIRWRCDGTQVADLEANGIG